MRSGHTEACVDLCRLAGLPPVGVLAELMNDDGTVMRGPEIAAFAERHKLAAAFHRRSDRLPAGARQADRAAGEFPVESEIGTLTGYAFQTPFDPFYHMAFVYGEIGDGRNVLTRLHRANLISRCVRRREDRSAARSIASRPRAGACWSCCATAPRACRSSAIPKSDETASGEARTQTMARGRSRRADPEGSRRQLDPAADLLAPDDLCRPFRIRHRNRWNGAGRNLTGPGPLRATIEERT